MTLKQLEYFLAIAESGSITKAANNLRISQPPLSLQLKGLEEELGCQLFIRDRKNMIITQKGVLLREQAREIVDKVNETIMLLQSAGESKRMTIQIGTITSICSRVLPEKVVTLKNRFPYVDFAIHEGSTTNILDMLSEGKVDFGFVREPLNLSAYSSLPVRDTALGEEGDDYFMAVGKEEYFEGTVGDSLNLTELRDKPIIIHRRYCDMFTGACRQQGFLPKIICQNDNIASSLNWAASGIGIAIAPYTSAILSDHGELVMKRIENPRIASKAHLIWHRNAILSAEQKAFIQLFE